MTCVSGTYRVVAPRPSAAQPARPAQSALSGDWLLIVVPGLIWGASFLFIAQGLRSVGPFGVAFVRILAGFATLMLFRDARRPIAREAWPRIAVLAVLWLAFPLTLFPFAEQRISSAVAGMLNGAVPIFAAAVAALIARRAPSRTMMIALAVGLSGVLLVAMPNLGAGGASIEGVVLVIIAVAAYGVSINIARPLQMTYGALPVLARALGLAALLTAPLGLRDVARAHWLLVPVLSLLALGALGTGIAYVLGTTAAGKLGATRASSAIFITSPVAMLLGVVVLHERIALISLVGVMLCIAGAVLVRRAGDRPTVAR